MMANIPSYVRKAQEKYKKMGQRQKSQLSPYGYYQCFDLVLSGMAESLSGKAHNYQLDFLERDGRITNEEAAKDDFYSHFKYSNKSKDLIVKYSLTSAFFQYSYDGLSRPKGVQRRKRESNLAFLKDCAKNYLLKNFWHNHVHERAQRITIANYHEFEDEARFASDFEADNLANILLALSYGHKVGAATSDQVSVRKDLSELFARNRCNKVFLLRALARKEDAEAKTVKKFQEKDYQNRRRFGNQLSVHLLERNRAVASLSMHFFGDVVKAGSIYHRPDTGMSVELNGIRIPVPKLGNIDNLSVDEFKHGAEAIIQKVDTEYAGLLRKDSEIRRFATVSLREKMRLLVNRSLVNLVTN